MEFPINKLRASILAKNGLSFARSPHVGPKSRFSSVHAPHFDPQFASRLRALWPTNRFSSARAPRPTLAQSRFSPARAPNGVLEQLTDCRFFRGPPIANLYKPNGNMYTQSPQ